MRKINGIVIHCSATRETQNYSLEDVRASHLKRGFNDVGYHYYITKDGIIHHGRMIDVKGAHVKGFNSDTIGVCYEGGLDSLGNPKDTRTDQQKASLNILVLSLLSSFPGVSIKGHREYSKDLNKDGEITKNEWMKSCPCFDVDAEFGNLR
jgi:N-acetyl-anhydromuramyl-L-alanine amidase AmpD